MTPQRLHVECPNPGSDLHPEWIAGFVDGEGCFHVAINKNDGVKFGYQILPELTVVQHKRDLNLLYRIKRAMKCGVVRKNREDRFCWRVRDLKNLHEIIIPFFERHPLKSKKNVEFKKFAKVVRLMRQGEHLTPEGFEKILQISSSMNRGNRREVQLGQRYSPHPNEN